MLNLNYVPHFRTVSSFDRLFDLYDGDTGFDAGAHPAHDVEKLDDNHYRISLAVPGFSRDELNIEAKGDVLAVNGRKEQANGRRLVRDFAQSFRLADHVRVDGANLVDGVLTIELVREIPEALKPRRIEIGNAAPTIVEKVKQVAGVGEAA